MAEIVAPLPAHAHQRTWLKRVLVVFNVLYILLLLPWLPMAVWSMLFLIEETDGSLISLMFQRVIPISILSYPVLVVVSLIFGWVAIRRERQGAALFLGGGLPSLSFVPWLFVLSLMLARVG